MTITHYIEEFLAYLGIEKGRSIRTIRNYRFYLNRFAHYMENEHRIKTPEKLNMDAYRSFRIMLSDPSKGKKYGITMELNKSTQNYHLIALRAFLKYLAKRDVKTIAPEKIELAKTGSREVEFISSDELKKLIDAPRAQKDECARLRDTALLLLFFSTGMRVSELTSLRRDGIDLDRDEFTVYGKGGKHRVVFLSDTARAALHAYLEKRTDIEPALFVSLDRAGEKRMQKSYETGSKEKKKTKTVGEVPQGGMTARTVQRLVEKYRLIAGIPKHVTPHTLRHSFATNLLQNGADIRSVQSMLGHASITTTQIYTHITNKQLREIHKKYHKT